MLITGADEADTGTGKVGLGRRGDDVRTGATSTFVITGGATTGETDAETTTVGLTVSDGGEDTDDSSGPFDPLVTLLAFLSI